MATKVNARLLLMQEQLGTLEPGKVANVVVWDGDPLENGSAAQLVLIDGVQQSLENRQTKLRDRYRSLERRALPEAL